MLSFLLKLGYQNLWRNKRRSLLTLGATATGVMALVGIHNYYDTFHDQVIRNAIRYHSGHLLITAPQYTKEYALNRFIKDASPILKRLQNEPRIKNYSSRVVVQGLLSSPRASVNVVLTGVEPQRETRVTHFFEHMVDGSYFKSNKQKMIVLGRKLAELLKVKRGAKVVVLTQAVDGSIGNELYRVEGIFDTNSDQDRTLAFISIADARALVGIPKTGAHQIAITLHNDSDLTAVRDSLKSHISAKRAEVLSWKEIQRPLMAMIELNKGANRMLVFIILYIASLGIANAILMGVLERTREFGVMLAIGTSKREIVQMVFAETFLLTLAGVILGNLLGIALTLCFGHIGFDLKWLTSQQLAVNGMLLETVSFPRVNWNNNLWITIVILVFSIVVSIIPIRHIRRLNPIQAIRHA